VKRFFEPRKAVIRGKPAQAASGDRPRKIFLFFSFLSFFFFFSERNRQIVIGMHAPVAESPPLSLFAQKPGVRIAGEGPEF